jgi:hypothetical protein
MKTLIQYDWNKFMVVDLDSAKKMLEILDKAEFLMEKHSPQHSRNFHVFTTNIDDIKLIPVTEERFKAWKLESKLFYESEE